MKPAIFFRIVVVLAVVGLTCCDSGRGPAERTIFSFVNSVQSENVDALRCLLAGASREVEDPTAAEAERRAFDAWVRSRYTEYLVGRDQGAVELGDDGIVLTKAFALGKGTFYEISRVRRVDETLVVDTGVRLAYGEIDISGLPPGTVFYACGLPMGVVEAVTIPRGAAEVEAEVLDTVTVRWTLVPGEATPECDERWTVASAVALPESATAREIVWEF
jgi:hypothetical protein